MQETGVKRMRQLPIYYSILGVGSDAGEDRIRRAYRVKARQLHPDVGGSSEQMRLLNEAYEILADLASRKRVSSEAAGRQVQRPPPIENDSAISFDARGRSELRWLITRSVLACLLGLICIAESANPLPMRYALYMLWLPRALGVVFLLQATWMLYAAHRMNQALYTAHRANKFRSAPVSAENHPVTAVRSVFRISIGALILLVILSELLLRELLF